VPSEIPSDDVRVADARLRTNPLEASPAPASLPAANATDNEVDVEYVVPVPTSPLTDTDPPVGPAESSVKVRDAVAVLSATSRPVTVSPGELELPAAHENGADTYGPPAGAETTDGACDHPLVEPVSAAVALEAGPESASLTPFVSVNEPAATPLYQTVVLSSSASPVTSESESAFEGATVSIFTTCDSTEDWFPAASSPTKRMVVVPWAETSNGPVYTTAVPDVVGSDPSVV
jgi:hypothetical protein